MTNGDLVLQKADLTKAVAACPRAKLTSYPSARLELGETAKEKEMSKNLLFLLFQGGC